MAATLNRITEYGKQIDFGKTAGDHGATAPVLPTRVRDGLPGSGGRAARYGLKKLDCMD